MMSYWTGCNAAQGCKVHSDGTHYYAHSPTILQRCNSTSKYSEHHWCNELACFAAKGSKSKGTLHHHHTPPAIMKIISEILHPF
jgi:hypothetical protein